MTQAAEQLGFDTLLANADAENEGRMFARETAHLPGDWTGAIAFHRGQITRHHAAMLACDFDAALALREEAHLLAVKLNGGEPGILAHNNAPGYRLARETAAPMGAIPLWGQDGRFEMEAADLKLDVTMRGMFGICATAMTYASFDVQAVEFDKPFLSATGHRSFMGAHVAPQEGLSTADFVRIVVETYVASDLKGRLVAIEPEYRKRRAGH